MVIKRGMDIGELAHEDRVHQRVYIDPAVFDLEMDRIYSNSWVYVGHESEVAQGGDYKTSYLGRRPVILTRNPDDGKVYVLFNRCRHRGASVCQFETGNSSYFRCAYHGWTYNNTGKLVGVPYRQGYGADFSPGELGLVPVARVEEYKGFIFASMNPDVQPLTDYLGEACHYLDVWVSQSPTEEIEVKWGVSKYSFNANWKLQLENTIDGYHFDFVHQDWCDLFGQRTGQRFQVPLNYIGRDLGNGHCVIAIEDGGPMLGPGFVLSIFPNLQFLWTQIRVLQPVSVDRTEVGSYVALPKGGSAEELKKRLVEHDNGFGPMGNIATNDWEMFERCQRGLMSDLDEWVLFNRGYKSKTADETGGPIRDDECPQRSIYRQWRKLMSSD